VQLRRQVEREAVAGDPARDAHADGTDLPRYERALLTGPRSSGCRVHPEANLAGHGAALHTERLHELVHDAREVVHVAAHVLTMRRKIEDGVGHELSGGMQRDVAAAAAADHLDAQRAQLRLGREDVLWFTATSQRDHRLVLQQEQRVADLPPLAGSDERRHGVVYGAI